MIKNIVVFRNIVTAHLKCTKVLGVVFAINIITNYCNITTHCVHLKCTKVLIAPHFSSLLPYNVVILATTLRGNNEIRKLQ